MIESPRVLGTLALLHVVLSAVLACGTTRASVPSRQHPKPAAARANQVTSSPLETVPNEDEVSSWSADGHWLAHSNERRTVILDVPSFRVVRRLQGSYEFRDKWFHERNGTHFWRSFDMSGPPLKDGMWSDPAEAGKSHTSSEELLGEIAMSDDGLFRRVKLPKGTCAPCDVPQHMSLFVASDRFAVYDVRCDSPNHPPRGLRARGNQEYGSSSSLLVDRHRAEARVLSEPGYWQGVDMMLLSGDQERLFVISEQGPNIAVFATRTGAPLETIMTAPSKHEGHHACADIDPRNDRLVVMTGSQIRVVPFGGHPERVAPLPPAGGICKLSVRDEFAMALAGETVFRLELPNLDHMERIDVGTDAYVYSDLSPDGKILLFKGATGWDLLNIQTFSRKRLLPPANRETFEQSSYDPSSRWLSLRGHIFDTSSGALVKDLSPELVNR